MISFILFICGLGIGSISVYFYLNHKIKVLDAEKEYIKSQLLDRSDKDSLSGLYTNYYVMDYLEERLQHLNERSLSVLLMDLDKFRIINDHFGHKYGDEVIRNVSDLLKSIVKPSDVLGRYGGEEFIVVLNDGDLERTLEVAECIRSKIEVMPIKDDKPLTISIGIAFYNNDTADSLIKKADDQLYQAKSLGKNRVKGEHL